MYVEQPAHTGRDYMYNFRGDQETFANNQRSELSWLLVVGGAGVHDSQFQLQ